ncbi:MAG: hypothetical protein AAFP82_04160 [Bacteroidota bacterium]
MIIPPLPKLYPIFLSLFATIALAVQWLSARKKYKEDYLLLDDYGILLFAVGWLFWTLQALVSDPNSPPQELLIVLSTLNNYCFLLAYKYLEYAPTQISFKPIRLKITLDENWSTFSASLCLFVVFASGLCGYIFTIIFSVEEIGSSYNEIKFLFSAFPDILLTIFVFTLLLKGLTRTYAFREDILSLTLSRFSIYGIILFQFIFLSNGILNYENYTSLDISTYVNNLPDHMSFIIKTIFLLSLYPLCASWISERRSLPNPDKMKIEFHGRNSEEENDKYWRIRITIDDHINHEEVELTLGNFQHLLDLCVYKLKNGEDSWKVLSEHKRKAISRAIEAITDVMIRRELRLSTDKLKAKIESKDPKIVKHKTQLLEALRKSLIINQPGKKEHRRIRILASNIVINPSVVLPLSEEVGKVKGALDRKELSNLISDIQLVLGKRPPEPNVNTSTDESVSNKG